MQPYVCSWLQLLCLCHHALRFAYMHVFLCSSVIFTYTCGGWVNRAGKAFCHFVMKVRSLFPCWCLLERWVMFRGSRQLGGLTLVQHSRALVRLNAFSFFPFVSFHVSIKSLSWSQTKKEKKLIPSLVLKSLTISIPVEETRLVSWSLCLPYSAYRSWLVLPVVLPGSQSASPLFC